VLRLIRKKWLMLGLGSVFLLIWGLSDSLELSVHDGTGDNIIIVIKFTIKN
jgi:hypothetical protein